MYCSRCGTDLPAGAENCPSCGFASPRLSPLRATPGKSRESLEEALRDAERAAKELARATARISKRVAAGAGKAARDPTGTAKKVTARLKEEIDQVASDLTEALKKI